MNNSVVAITTAKTANFPLLMLYRCIIDTLKDEFEEQYPYKIKYVADKVADIVDLGGLWPDACSSTIVRLFTNSPNDIAKKHRLSLVLVGLRDRR